MVRFMIYLACLIGAAPVSAGQVAALDGKLPAIGIGGRIEAGDERVFHDLARKVPNALIVLAGPGGSVGYAGDATATIVNTPATGVRWLDRIELNSNGFAAQSYP